MTEPLSNGRFQSRYLKTAYMLTILVILGLLKMGLDQIEENAHSLDEFEAFNRE